MHQLETRPNTGCLAQVCQDADDIGNRPDLTRWVDEGTELLISTDHFDEVGHHGVFQKPNHHFQGTVDASVSPVLGMEAHRCQLLAPRSTDRKRVTKKANTNVLAFLSKIRPRRRPTLPHKKSCSTIGAEKLNDRVRDGIGWDLLAKTTEN